MTAQTTPPLPDVNISEFEGVRCLHLGSEWIQGTMFIKKPLVLELEYIQRMMAWLLLTDPQQLDGAKALQLGLGAGSLTKFCAVTLKLETTVIEINPKVIQACQAWFHLPPQGPLLRIINTDAALAIQDPELQHRFDVVHIDLYDHEAAAPVLDDSDFYQQCRELLTDRGCISVNLFGRHASFATSLQRIAKAFGPAAVWAFKPTKEGNTVVLAQKTPTRPDRDTLQTRATHIEAHHPLPASKWLKALKPAFNVSV